MQHLQSFLVMERRQPISVAVGVHKQHLGDSSHLVLLLYLLGRITAVFVCDQGYNQGGKKNHADYNNKAFYCGKWDLDVKRCFF